MEGQRGEGALIGPWSNTEDFQILSYGLDVVLCGLVLVITIKYKSSPLVCVCVCAGCLSASNALPPLEGCAADRYQ